MKFWEGKLAYIKKLKNAYQTKWDFLFNIMGDKLLFNFGSKI